MAQSLSAFATIVEYVSVTAAFAPPAAALWTRRAPRSPAGLAALAWLGIALFGVVYSVAFDRYGAVPPATHIAAAGTALYLPVFLPPTLRWIGPGARRWYWPVALVWLLCAGALGALLGTGREFRTVVAPLVSIAMWIPTAWALAACVRRAPEEVRRQDWFWLLTAQLLFFSIDVVRKPLIETMMARHWNAMVAVHYGLVSLYPVCYLLAAYGLLLRQHASTTRAAPGAPGAAMAQPGTT